MVGLGDLPGGQNSSVANDVSADGSVRPIRTSGYRASPATIHECGSSSTDLPPSVIIFTRGSQ